MSANTPPSAPSGLSAAPSGASVTLSWTASSDGQTPADGLTYNLRVGTAPGGIDVVAPMAAPASGTRIVVALGNAQHGTSAFVNLAPATYHWGVQALDSAFAGSSFTSGGSFTVDLATQTPAPTPTATSTAPAANTMTPTQTSTATPAPTDPNAPSPTPTPVVYVLGLGQTVEMGGAISTGPPRALVLRVILAGSALP
jgi:hypothetical protein